MTDPRVAAVRRFNRFYTRQIGVLDEGFLHSPFTLAEGRVLYELAQQREPIATAVGDALGLDAGYLSRILRRFERRGLLRRQPSEVDARRSLIALTARGRAALAKLDARSQTEVRAMLGRISEPEQRRLIESMRAIEGLLGSGPPAQAGYVLRPHHPGDMGWIVHRQAVLYAREYGWDEQFEALVAGVVAEFIRSFDPKRERCWIADREGEILGSVFLVKQSDTVAKLRLLYVEPAARGLGIGTRLVGECVRAARRLGYRTLTLWTQQSLHAARHIYQQAGFRLVRSEPHHSFGHDLVGETWELELN